MYITNRPISLEEAEELVKLFTTLDVRYYCPISHEIMTTPVLFNGKIYELNSVQN